MTESTKVLSIRLNNKDKEELSKYITRDSLEHILRQIKRGEVVITSKGVEIKRVNTTSEGVNTAKIGKSIEEIPKNTGVNTCEECPYVSDLNMSGFDEVCEYKGLDRQKALDKCVQMLWR